jgi:hypothetical protein
MSVAWCSFWRDPASLAFAYWPTHIAVDAVGIDLAALVEQIGQGAARE